MQFHYFAEDDWENSHRKLVDIEVGSTQSADFDKWLRRKGLQHGVENETALKGTERPANDDDEFNDDLDREEVNNI